MDLPRTGDVIFLDCGGVAGHASAVVQRLVDTRAKAQPRLSHVAIVLDASVALEAMPERREGPGKSGNAPAPTPWTGVDLPAGARIVPIADLACGATIGDARLIALRPPGGPDLAECLSVTNPRLAALIGSEYSVASLQDAAGERSSPALARLAGRWAALGSSADDLATRLGITPEMRAQIEDVAPTSEPPLSSTFFCSQLVLACLELAKLGPPSADDDLVTPMGLHALLEHQWTDVSSQYAMRRGATEYVGRGPDAHAESYRFSVAAAEITCQTSALSMTVDVLGGFVARATRQAEEATARLLGKRGEAAGSLGACNAISGYEKGGPGIPGPPFVPRGLRA